MKKNIKEEKRHTCIFCGSKRFQRRLTSFTFVSWITPVTKSRVKHWACNFKKFPFEQNCFEKILNTDFNPVIIP